LPRVLSTVLVLGLLVGTSAAFAITERLKLVPSPIIAPKVTEAFSPVCDCSTDSARVQFRLRKRDRLTVSIVDADGGTVETIAERESTLRAPSISDGTDEAPGGRVPREGAPRPRAPHDRDPEHDAARHHAARRDSGGDPARVFSPDGDGRADAVHAFFTVSERASVLLLVDGDRAVESPPRLKGKLDWYGRGKPEGTYDVSLARARLAGNEARPTAPTPVRLRFIAVSPRAWSLRAACASAFASRPTSRATAGSSAAVAAPPRRACWCCARRFRRALHARGRLRRTQQRSSRLREAAAVIASGVIGALGLAALIVVQQRRVRLAALALTVVGGAILVVTLRPKGTTRGSPWPALSARSPRSASERSSSAGRGCSRWRRSHARPRASPSRSAARKRAFSCPCTSSSPVASSPSVGALAWRRALA
jgi:hypothetical protein